MTFDPDKNLKRIADEISDDTYLKPSVLKEIAWALESIAKSMDKEFKTLEHHRDEYTALLEAYKREHLSKKP